MPQQSLMEKNQQGFVTRLDRGYIRLDEAKNAKRYRITEQGLRVVRYSVKAVEDVMTEPLP